MSQAKEELLSGHFEKGRNIGDVDYLAEVAQSVGIDADETRRILATDEYTAEVKADIAEAQALGANGVPFFVTPGGSAGRFRLVGAGRHQRRTARTGAWLPP